jgi:hypothetical protein
MKTTNSFWSILSLTAAMFFFVSCSNNDDAPSTKLARSGNQTMSDAPPIPQGDLHINNYTMHTFENSLTASHTPSQNFPFHSYQLWRGIIIDNNTNYLLHNYHDTATLNMNNSPDDYWNVQDITTPLAPSVVIKGLSASTEGDSDYHMIGSGTNAYVQWVGLESFHTENTDTGNGTVNFRFKINIADANDIYVNPGQEHTHADGNLYKFTTTAYIDSNGDTIIDIEDIGIQ